MIFSYVSLQGTINYTPYIGVFPKCLKISSNPIYESYITLDRTYVHYVNYIL